MDIVLDILMVLVPMLMALTVHEYSHARAALWLGDDTAYHRGRLSLNPMVHADLLGTFLLPILAVASKSNFFFGWARPVPVDPSRFLRRFGGRRVTMRTGMMVTAVAGPLSNLVFGIAAAVVFKVLLTSGVIAAPWQGQEAVIVDSGARLGGASLAGDLTSPVVGDSLEQLAQRSAGLIATAEAQPAEPSSAAASLCAHAAGPTEKILTMLILINFILAIFNLLPLPPLDGSRVLGGILPRSASRYLDYLEANTFVAFIILIGLLGTGILGLVMSPVFRVLVGSVCAVTGIDPAVLYWAVNC